MYLNRRNVNCCDSVADSVGIVCKGAGVENDAVEMVRQMYLNCDFVLDASDYVETEISVKQ